MPVYTRCPQCGKAYAAEDNMAGQEVLCRKCGAGFRLPAPGADSNLPAELTSPPGSSQQDLSDTDTAGAVDSGAAKVETFDSGMKERGVGSAKSRLDVNGPVDSYELGGTAAGRALGENPPFDFPMAADLDRWLPKLVIALMLVWTVWQASGWTPLHPGEPETGRTQPSWSWFLLAGWLLIVYLAVWLPIVYASVRRAMTQMALRVPLRRMPRVAAIAVLPFAVGAVFWLTGESIASLITGVILGCIPAGGAAFFLLRLRERQIVQALPPIIAGIAIAAGISAGLTWGVSSLLGTTLKTYRMTDVFAGSPFGPCLTWPERELAAVSPGSRSIPGTGNTARPGVTGQPRPRPQTPITVTSPLVERIEPVAVGDDFDAAVFPRQPSENFDMSVVPPRVRDLVAIQRRSKTDETVDLMFVGEAPVLATAKFSAEEGLGEIALSGDGRSLARLASFPRLSVHVWSFSTGRVARWFDLSRDGGPYRIVGFNARGEILVQSGRVLRGTERVPGLSLEWLDPQTGGRRPAMDLPGSYSPVVTYSRDLSHVAVINTAREMPVLEIYQVPVTGLPPRPVQILLDGVDAALAARPSAVALSPDNGRVAVTFEQKGQLVLMLWDATTGTSLADYVFPGGLDLPGSTQANPQRSLVWLGDPNALLYAGNVVFDPNSGRCFGSLSLGEVAQVLPIGGRSMWVELAATAGRHRLVKVKLSSQVGPATQPTTRAAPVEMFR